MYYFEEEGNQLFWLSVLNDFRETFLRPFPIYVEFSLFNPDFLRNFFRNNLKYFFHLFPGLLFWGFLRILGKVRGFSALFWNLSRFFWEFIFQSGISEFLSVFQRFFKIFIFRNFLGVSFYGISFFFKFSFHSILQFKFSSKILRVFRIWRDIWKAYSNLKSFL